MKRYDFDIDNVDADGLASNVASSGASVDLDGALISGGTYTSADGFAHRLSILDKEADDQSTATFTVTGTDADGIAQTEAITGPAASATVESTKYFKTVSSITIANGVATALVDVGTVDEFASKTIPLDHLARRALSVHVNVTGTINYDIQVTAISPFDRSSAAPFNIADQESFNWINDGNFGAKTADLLDDLALAGARALRVVSNSFTDGAELQVYLSQPRNQ